MIQKAWRINPAGPIHHAFPKMSREYHARHLMPGRLKSTLSIILPAEITGPAIPVLSTGIAASVANPYSVTSMRSKYSLANR
jgi:hypothetical protein